MIQLTFAEIFVPQDFTIKLLLGSVETQTHVAVPRAILVLLQEDDGEEGEEDEDDDDEGEEDDEEEENGEDEKAATAEA